MPAVAEAAPRRSADAVVTVVLPFSAADDTGVDWAVARFAATGGEELRVVHPDRAGVSFADLAELRDRFACRLAARFTVLVGRPGDPHPTLRFVRR